MKACVYFETFHYTSHLDLDLLDGETIVGVTQAGAYRQVWIAGTPETKDARTKAKVATYEALHLDPEERAR